MGKEGGPFGYSMEINLGNEEILNTENLEPTSDTNEDYTQISHYQKSGYSVQVMEQKPKKKVSKKNVVNKSLQTDSKVSIFRRKEMMDESEQTNISARTSYVTPLKKQLQSNSPQLQDQESYCNNELPVAYQPLQTPKSFQEGFEQEIIFPEGTEIKKACVQESDHGTEQVGQELEQISQRNIVQESQHSIQQPEGQESRRGSRSVAVQESWHSIQKQEGQKSKQDSQQPAVPESEYNIQEPKIFGVQQETQLRGQQVETEKTKPEEQKPKRRRKIQKIKIDQAQQTDSTQSLKRELLEKNLQTDVVSIAKIRTQLGMQESRHGSHQYDLQKTGKPVISDLCIDSLPQKQQDFHQVSKPIPELHTYSLPVSLSETLHDSQRTEVQEFRHSSLPLEDRQVHHKRPSVGLKEFEHEIHQLKKKDNQSDKLFELKQKSQHGSLGTENKIDDAKEPPGIMSSENRTMPLKQKMSFGQQTYSIISLEETTWLNRRSGKLMQNQSQQTNESWLQNYRERKNKLASKEALSKNNESGVQKSQRISSESGTNEQYTALETRRSGEQAAMLESLEDSKHSPSLECQRSTKYPLSLETEKRSELPATSDSWKAKQSFVPEVQTNGEQFAMLYSQKDGGQVTIPEYQRDNNESMFSEFGKSIEVSATTEFQKGNEELTLSESPKATEYPPPNSQRSSEKTLLPVSERCSEKDTVSESHFVSEFQKADFPPVFESQSVSEQPISSESEMGSEYPPLLDFRKGSRQPAIPESSECNEQPICPESQKFDEPTVSESQNNSEWPTIPEFQRDSDHPCELEPPKGSEQLTVSESKRDSKQPDIQELQRSIEPLIECKFRRDSMKPDISETQMFSESLIVLKSQRDSEQAIMPESWSVSQQSTKLLLQWESKQPVVLETEHQLVADKVNKVAGNNILESDINDSKQEPSCASKAQQTYSIISVGRNTWKNRRTGKLMTCSSQQTERSWLQEHRERKENFTPKGSFARNSIPEEKKTELDKIHHAEDDRKKMIAQQDICKDESQPENQMATAGLIKEKDLISFESNEAKKELQESKVAEVVEYCLLSQHADLPFQHISQQPEVTTSQPDSQQTKIAASKQVSQQAVLTVSQQASKEAEVPESQQASQKTETSQQAEDIADQQTSQQQEIMASEQEEGMVLQISSKLDVEKEFDQGSKQSVKHEFHYNDILWSTPSNDAQQSYESASRSTLDSSSSYVEGEDEALQTYSRISLENGVWLNRKTGKVLINHSQQTSMSLLSKTVLENNGNSAGCPKPPISDVKLNEAKFDQQTCSSNKSSETTSSNLSSQQSWDEVQSIDEVEKVLVSHVSTNFLSTQSVAYVEMQYEAAVTYDSLYMPKGSWINLKTGKVLVSKYQQTDESSFQKSKENIQPVRHPSYTPELSYYDLSDMPVNEGSQQTWSDADVESKMPDG